MKKLAWALPIFFVSWAAVQGQPRSDLHFQQSPPKPAPEWVKIVDHGQYDPRLKGYFAPEGIRIEIVAEAPDVINPVGITFGPDGTLYVLEWVEAPGEKAEVEFSYKDGSRRKVLIMRKPTKDRVKTLGYNAKKGVFDSSKIALEEELPSSILLHDGWLYLSGQGTVRRYRQSTPNGAWDKKEIIAHGFCGYHHHQVSGLTIGNDGWLYITAGDNDNFVEGSDGSRATVLRTGAIFRCRPDGSKMHTYSLGYRNPYRDVVFDAGFNMFHADNDNEDGSKFSGCRLMHIPQGADFGWRLRTGAICCVPDFARGAVYGELPGKVAPMLKTGRGAPAGLFIYNDSAFPLEYRGLLLYPDVLRKVIRAYTVAPQGATFQVTQEFELMRSHDPLFRPCQMVLGPDGAIYICDWRTDSGGAGKLSGDGKNGRIYRLSWKGTTEQPALPLRPLDSWAKIVAQTDDELLNSLDSPNFSDRQQAQRELVRRGDKTRNALLVVLKADDTKSVTARIAALGALQSMWNDDVKATFIGRLADFEADIRRLAADGLADNCRMADNDAHEALVQHINDEKLAVRRAIYLAIGRVRAPDAADVIINGLQFDTRKDDYYTDGLARALELTGKDGITKLLALADSGSEKDLGYVLDIYPSLRIREAAEKIPVLLKNYHVKPEQKVTLIHSYLYYQLDPPVSVEPLVRLLKYFPPQTGKRMTGTQLDSIKLAALNVLAANGKIESGIIEKTLIEILKTNDPQSRTALMHTIAETKLFSAAPILLEQLARSEDDSAKLLLVRTLGQLNDPASLKPLEGLLKSRETTLRIEAFRALVNIDDRAAHKGAEILLPDEDPLVQREAIVLLGQHVDGARLVGTWFADKKLPRSLLPEVTESLRRYANAEHPDVSPLLSRVVKGVLLGSLEPVELKRVSAMVKEQGDPLRGRKVYLNNKAVACISCHRLEGIGGNVGPDLTRVWDTLSLEKVLESMLDPSKEIKEGYQSFVATTKKGLGVTGLKVAQNPKTLILKDAAGKEVSIDASDLGEVVASKRSLMPDDVMRHLSFNEFLDLVAFLRDRKTQEDLRGMILTAWALGPVEFDLTKTLPVEKTADPTEPYLTAEKRRIPWKAVQADMSDKGFDLGPIIGQVPASGYVLTYVHSPKDQKARLQYQTDEKTLVWLDGSQIETKEGAAQLTLHVGWNTLLFRMNNEAGNPRLQARLVDAEGLRISLRKD